MAKTVFDKILDTTTGPKSYNWYRKEVKKMFDGIPEYGDADVEAYSEYQM